MVHVLWSKARVELNRVEPCSQLGRPPPVAAAAALKTKPEVDNDEREKVGSACTATQEQHVNTKNRVCTRTPSAPHRRRLSFLKTTMRCVRRACMRQKNAQQKKREKQGTSPRGEPRAAARMKPACSHSVSIGIKR